MQAILRKAKTLGLTRQIEGNGRIFLRKIYSLALLPAENIVPAFQSLQVILLIMILFLIIRLDR